MSFISETKLAGFPPPRERQNGLRDFT